MKFKIFLLSLLLSVSTILTAQSSNQFSDYVQYRQKDTVSMTHDSTKFQKIETKVVTYAKNHKVLVSHAGITLLGIVCGIPAIPLITIMGLSELTNVIVNK